MKQNLIIDVLKNDSLPGRNSIVEISSQVTGGKAEVLKDRTIRSTPEPDFVGQARFECGLTDGKDGTLTVSVAKGVLVGYGFDGWTAGVAEKPRHGTVKINKDGSPEQRFRRH